MADDDVTTPHVLPDSIEIGGFRVGGHHLTASILFAVCGGSQRDSCETGKGVSDRMSRMRMT
jgi:hypothetical protein